MLNEVSFPYASLSWHLCFLVSICILVVHLGHSYGTVIPLSPVNWSLHFGRQFGTRCVGPKQIKLLNAGGICSLERGSEVRKLLEAPGDNYSKALMTGLDLQGDLELREEFHAPPGLWKTSLILHQSCSHAEVVEGSHPNNKSIGVPDGNSIPVFPLFVLEGSCG